MKFSCSSIAVGCYTPTHLSFSCDVIREAFRILRIYVTKNNIFPLSIVSIFMFTTSTPSNIKIGAEVSLKTKFKAAICFIFRNLSRLRQFLKSTLQITFRHRSDKIGMEQASTATKSLLISSSSLHHVPEPWINRKNVYENVRQERWQYQRIQQQRAKLSFICSHRIYAT